MSASDLRDLERRNPATVIRHQTSPARRSQANGAARGVALVLLAFTVVFFAMFLLGLNS